MARGEQGILTTKMLAQELDISLDQAKALMQQDGFPATETAPGHYAVTRESLAEWVRANARAQPFML